MSVSEDNTEKDANDPVAKAVSQVYVKVAAAKTVSVSHISEEDSNDEELKEGDEKLELQLLKMKASKKQRKRESQAHVDRKDCKPCQLCPLWQKGSPHQFAPGKLAIRPSF